MGQDRVRHLKWYHLMLRGILATHLERWLEMDCTSWQRLLQELGYEEICAGSSLFRVGKDAELLVTHTT